MAYQFLGEKIDGETMASEKIDNQPFKLRLDLVVVEARRVIVVGWKPETGYPFFRWLAKEGKDIILVEAFQHNVESFDEYLGGRHRVAHKMHMDVRDLLSAVPIEARDCLVWQDGPEHIEMNQAVQLLRQFQESFNSIIIATPNGPYNQGILDGNVWEIHRSTWYAETYKELGFEVADYEAGLIGYWRQNGRI